MILEKLLLHVLIVLAPVLIVSFFFDATKGKRSPLVLIALQIMAAMLCMLFSNEEFGVYWDLRYVPMVLAFLYGGPKAGWTVCISILLLRTWIGGDHLLVAYGSILLSALIPHLFTRFSQQILSKWKRVRIAILIAFCPALVKIGFLILLVKRNEELCSHLTEIINYVGTYALTLVIAMVFGTLLHEEMNE